MKIDETVIGKKVDPETGFTVLWMKYERGGPIVSGSTYDEALMKLRELLPIAILCNKITGANPSNN